MSEPAAAGAHTGRMLADDDRELPVAVLRPGRMRGQAAATGGEVRRWARGRARALRAHGGRPLAFVMLGLVFAAMLLAMGQASDRARARERAQREAIEARIAAQQLGVLLRLYEAHGAAGEAEADADRARAATAPPLPLQVLGAVRSR